MRKQALLKSLFKIGAVYLNETLIQLSEGYALLSIPVRSAHEDTCNVRLSSSNPHPPLTHLSPCLLLGCHQGSPKHLPAFSSLGHDGPFTLSVTMFLVWPPDSLLECSSAPISVL